MKQLVMVMILLLLPLISLAEVRYIQVEKARLLSKPTAFSRSLLVLPYQTAVEVTGSSGAFMKVRTEKGTMGYIPKTSLVIQKPKYASKLSKNYISSEEVALATKGFNEQVEANYRRDHTQLPYEDLNRMEKNTTYSDAMEGFKSFRQQGKLGEFQEGGSK